jgi:hypothetical protein
MANLEVECRDWVNDPPKDEAGDKGGLGVGRAQAGLNNIEMEGEEEETEDGRKNDTGTWAEAEVGKEDGMKNEARR